MYFAFLTNIDTLGLMGMKILCKNAEFILFLNKYSIFVALIFKPTFINNIQK